MRGGKATALLRVVSEVSLAVLVGVLAPTLIKNIEKSRESKDAQNCEQLKSSVEIALQNETAYSTNVKSGGKDIVTITSSGVTIASDAGTDFTTEFTGQIDTSKTKLTSKKYKDVTGGIKINVNEKGQVTIVGLPS